MSFVEQCAPPVKVETTLLPILVRFIMPSIFCRVHWDSHLSVVYPKLGFCALQPILVVLYHWKMPIKKHATVRGQWLGGKHAKKKHSPNKVSRETSHGICDDQFITKLILCSEIKMFLVLCHLLKKNED